MHSQSIVRSCYIAASSSADLRPILGLLSERRIRVLDPAQISPEAVTLTDQVTDTIRQADLVIGVLNHDSPNASAFFEIGFAYALGKRILVLAPENVNVPSDLQGLLYVPSGAENLEAVTFALDQLLATSRPILRHKGRLPQKSKPIGQTADFLLGELNETEDIAPEQTMERIVRLALEATGISVLAQSDRPDLGADFAVWVDELESIVGNPILIEVKSQLHNSRQVAAATEQVLSYLGRGTSHTAIIFYEKQLDLDIHDAVVHSWAFQSPSLYFLEIREFLLRLRNESFATILRKERNKKVHKAPR